MKKFLKSNYGVFFLLAGCFINIIESAESKNIDAFIGWTVAFGSSILAVAFDYIRHRMHEAGKQLAANNKRLSDVIPESSQAFAELVAINGWKFYADRRWRKLGYEAPLTTKELYDMMTKEAQERIVQKQSKTAAP